MAIVRTVHPIERLRSVARAEGAGPSLLAREAAEALVGLDPESLSAAPLGPSLVESGQLAPDRRAFVTALRRLVDRHPTVGTMWWLAARVMASSEPGREARRACEAIEMDSTPNVLGSALPDDATVVIVGWPEQVSEALRRRGDLEVLVVDCLGEGFELARRLHGSGMEAELVPDAGLGTAVCESDLVLLEASAMGPDGFLASAGSRAGAAVAHHAGIPVWLVAGVGRVLPDRLWEALLARLDQAPEEPWHCSEELVPLALADHAARPEGVLAPADAAGRGDCPVVAELLRPVG
ncbi:MAG: hypothetical protein M3N28_08340 [Actinomycetota bacterium]|nr:hypothetical protein [Actinomycetota bacterium]